MKIRQLHVDLPDELYARLQAFGRADKRTVRAVVEMALVDFFKAKESQTAVDGPCRESLLKDLPVKFAPRKN
jgi:predicted transcriptional regulator